MNISRILVVAAVVSLLGGRAPAAKLSNNDVKGVYSFAVTASGSLVESNQTTVSQTINRVGVITADAKGGLTGHSISVLDDGTNVTIIDYNWSGTYTINSDGTGTVTFNAPKPADINQCRDGSGAVIGGCSELVGQEKFSFAIVSGQKSSTLALIQTDPPVGSPRLFLRGTATTQIVKGGGGGGGGGIGFPF